MTEENKTPEGNAPAGNEEKPSGGSGIPGFEEVRGEVKELAGRLAQRDKDLEEARETIKGLKGSAETIDRLKDALSGGQAKSDAEVRKEQFYALLVSDPEKAIASVFENREALNRQRIISDRVMTQLDKFEKAYPEFKAYEAEMRDEIAGNPSMMAREGFLEKVLIGIVVDKDPDLARKLIDRRASLMGSQKFRFEGASATDHAPDDEGKAIMDRFKSASQAKKDNYFL